MSLRFSIRSPLAFAAIAAVGLGATGAGAVTVHRFAVIQDTGSEGATAFVQQTANQSALQGEVNASPNTGLKMSFGVLGEYDASGSTFGIGVAGVSTTGYGVGAETFAGQPAKHSSFAASRTSHWIRSSLRSFPRRHRIWSS